MARNTKEISLIQHRTGKLSEMPKALNQSEIGVAYDENKIFVGNSKNTILANRTVFPYQNLEILTEFSNLSDYFRYSYENNIKNTDVDDGTSTKTITDRLKLKEYLPLSVVFSKSPVIISATSHIIINDTTIEFLQGDELFDVINKINEYTKDTKVYASTLDNNHLTLISVCGELEIKLVEPSLISDLGEPEVTTNPNMPERKITEKADDFLNITDFGVKGDCKTNFSEEIYKSLIEVYRKYDDSQYYRNVFFPAGTYIFNTKTSNISYDLPFPLISNMHIHGEGIDRTIISNNGNYTLLNCLDDDTNTEASENYGVSGKYPTNILIEDMTFETNALSEKALCELKCASNVTFNRVKFKANSNNTQLVRLFGLSNIESSDDSGEIYDDIYTNNITFNECIFEGATEGIVAEDCVKNVTITNCLFKNISKSSIKIGDSLDNTLSLCKGFNINGNILENTPLIKTSGTYAIYLGENADYCSIHQTQFDESLFENWKNNLYPQPYNKDYNVDSNYIDTLDPNTDEKKILGFHFSQPDWRYLDYLINQSGKTVLTVDKEDSDVDSVNGLNIKSNNNRDLDIRAVGTNPNNVLLSMDSKKNLELGKSLIDIEWKPSTEYSADDVVSHRGIIYTCNFAHTSSLIFDNDESYWDETSITQIIIDKVLQLNDKLITNRGGSENITIEPALNKIIEIKDNKSAAADNYEKRIDDKPDAIPNVAYVKNTSTLAFEKIFTYDDFKNKNINMCNLLHFDTTKYGENIHLKRLTISTRVPFYKYFTSDKAVPYSINRVYYQGDVVYGNVDSTIKYAVVLNNHFSNDNNNIVNNENLEIIDDELLNANFKPAKYMALIGTSHDGNGYILTNTYREKYEKPDEIDKDMIDIQSNNTHGYTNCREFTVPYDTSINPLIVKYCNGIYVLEEDTTYTDINVLHTIHYDDEDVRVPSVTRKYEEGYTYVFELDKDYSFNTFEFCDDGNEFKPVNDNPATVNFADGNLYMEFYDEEYNPVNVKTLNPAGKLLVRVEFIRDEV